MRNTLVNINNITNTLDCQYSTIKCLSILPKLTNFDFSECPIQCLPILSKITKLCYYYCDKLDISTIHRQFYTHAKLKCLTLAVKI